MSPLKRKEKEGEGTRKGSRRKERRRKGGKGRARKGKIDSTLVFLLLSEEACRLKIPEPRLASSTSQSSQYLGDGNRRMGIQGQPQLLGKFMASLGYLRSCLKSIKNYNFKLKKIIIFRFLHYVSCCYLYLDLHNI